MKTALVAMLAPLRTFWQQQSVRDRRLLVGLLLALIAAFELLMVWPARTKRLAVQAAVQADVQARQQAGSDRAQALASSKSVLTAELATIDSELRRIDARGTRREPLAALMQRAVGSHELSVRGLRALPVQEITLEAPAAEGAAPAPAAADPAASAAAPTTVYRHRVELRLAGPALPLLRRLDSVLAQLAPLRVERVLLAAAPDGSVEATVTMFTIAAERTWLEL